MTLAPHLWVLQLMWDEIGRTLFIKKWNVTSHKHMVAWKEKQWDELAAIKKTKKQSWATLYLILSAFKWPKEINYSLRQAVTVYNRNYIFIGILKKISKCEGKNTKKKCFFLSFHEDNNIENALSWTVHHWIQEQKLVLKILFYVFTWRIYWVQEINEIINILNLIFCMFWLG